MSNWKFSWGPFYNIYEKSTTEGDLVPVYDPPHGDYYSRPSQPRYAAPCGGKTAKQIIDEEVERVRRESQLKRQEFAEPFAAPYYFWLGIDAELRLW
jgi:hypothetical protein